MARIDILLDESNDLAIQNGDLLSGEADDQHVMCLIMDQPGDWRQNPTICFGINSYLKKSTADTRKFAANMRIALAADGYKVKSLDLSQGFEKFNLDYE